MGRVIVPVKSPSAREAVGPTESMWTLLKGWRGSPKLLAHVADVCRECVEAAGSDEPSCEIAVWVEGDVEHFSSPARFRRHVTEEALRRFSCVSLTARAADDSVVVAIDIARKEHPEYSWLKGVVLFETATGPDSLVAAEALHPRVAAALMRGSKGEGLGAIVAASDDSPESAVRAWRATLRRDRLIAAGAFGAFCVFVALGVWLGSALNLDVSSSAWIALLLGAFAGTALSTTFVALNPSFEISEQTRADRVLRVLFRGVGPVLGAIAAVALKIVAG